MAAAAVDQLRALVTRRDQEYATVEGFASLRPGDDEYDALLAEHSTAALVQQVLDAKVRRRHVPSLCLPSFR